VPVLGISQVVEQKLITAPGHATATT